MSDVFALCNAAPIISLLLLSDYEGWWYGLEENLTIVSQINENNARLFHFYTVDF